MCVCVCDIKCDNSHSVTSVLLSYFSPDSSPDCQPPPSKHLTDTPAEMPWGAHSVGATMGLPLPSLTLVPPGVFLPSLGSSYALLGSLHRLFSPLGPRVVSTPAPQPCGLPNPAGASLPLLQPLHSGQGAQDLKFLCSGLCMTRREHLICLGFGPDPTLPRG